MAHDSKQERIAEFERICREQCLPLTIQRRAVFDAILDRKDHPTAEQVYAEIRHRIAGISRATVYRILETLVRLGVIDKICHHGSSARFDPMIQQHHHLVCMECERIIDLEDQRLSRIDWPDVQDHGFRITDYHIHFRGVCAACSRSMGKPAAKQRKSAQRAPKPAGRKKTRSTSKRRNTS